jgi:hypothetical protein
MQPPKPEANQPQPPAAQQEELMRIELEHNIPLKQPNQQVHDSSTPVSAAKQFIETEAKGDKHLDGLLKDASREVKNMAITPAKQAKYSLKNMMAKFRKPAQPKTAAPAATPKSQLPIMVVAASVFVSAALIVAAVYAFNQNKTLTARNSSGASVAGASPASESTSDNSSVKPSDLTDLASALQSKLDKLNDTSDFNSQGLSDQALGL